MNLLLLNKDVLLEIIYWLNSKEICQIMQACRYFNKLILNCELIWSNLYTRIYDKKPKDYSRIQFIKKQKGSIKLCDSGRHINEYKCCKCRLSTPLVTFGECTIFYKDQKIPIDKIKIYCMFCAPNSANSFILHGYCDNYHSICQYNQHCINHLTLVPEFEGSIDTYEDDNLYRISSYICCLCGGYDKYYTLLGNNGYNYTQSRYLPSDCWILCSECSPRSWRSIKREEETYSTFTYFPINTNLNIDCDAKRILDILIINKATNNIR